MPPIHDYILQRVRYWNITAVASGAYIFLIHCWYTFYICIVSFVYIFCDFTIIFMLTEYRKVWKCFVCDCVCVFVCVCTTYKNNQFTAEAKSVNILWPQYSINVWASLFPKTFNLYNIQQQWKKHTNHTCIYRQQQAECGMVEGKQVLLSGRSVLLGFYEMFIWKLMFVWIV